MSDKSKRVIAANGPSKATQGKVPSPKEGTRFSNRLRSLLGEIEGLRKETAGFQEYDDLLSSQNDLREDLARQSKERQELERIIDTLRKDKDSEIDRLQSEIDHVKHCSNRNLHDFGERYKSWDADKSKHAADAEKLSALEVELETMKQAAETSGNERERLEREYTETSTHLEKEQRASKSLSKKLQITTLRLEEEQDASKKYRETIKSLRNDIGILPLDVTVREKMQGLATDIHQLAQQYFSNELSEPGASEEDPRVRAVMLTVRQIIGHPSLAQIPQVASNSPAARSMRCACAEALIARNLMNYIFLDFYITDATVGNDVEVLAKIMDRMTEHHLHETTIIRCQLAKACDKSGSPEPDQFVKEVCATLNGWLTATAKQQFSIRLTSIIQQAIELWQNLQRAQGRVKAYVELNNQFWDSNEDKRDTYGGMSLEEGQLPPTMLLTGPLAVLFPQVICDEKYLYHGHALFSTQDEVVAADQERKKHKYGQNSLRRRSHTESRAINSTQQMIFPRRMSLASQERGRESTAPSTSSEVSQRGVPRSNNSKGRTS